MLPVTSHVELVMNRSRFGDEEAGHLPGAQLAYPSNEWAQRAALVSES